MDMTPPIFYIKKDRLCGQPDFRVLQEAIYELFEFAENEPNFTFLPMNIANLAR